MNWVGDCSSQAGEEEEGGGGGGGELLPGPGKLREKVEAEEPRRGGGGCPGVGGQPLKVSS